MHKSQLMCIKCRHKVIKFSSLLEVCEKPLTAAEVCEFLKKKRKKNRKNASEKASHLRLVLFFQLSDDPDFRFLWGCCQLFFFFFFLVSLVCH